MANPFARRPERGGPPSMVGHGGAGAHVDVAVPVEGVVLRCSAVGLGPVVVLLHAGGERRSVWKPVAERVAAQGFRVISVDQRGHGETKGPVARTLEPYASDLRGLLASLDTPVHLVGASLGGLASVLALAEPVTRVRVSGLVLVDVTPSPDPARARDFLRGLEIDDSSPRGPRWDWSLVEDILARGPDLLQVAASLRFPVTLVRGSESPVLRSEDAQRLAEVIPHVVLRDVPGAGHLVAQDRPERLADEILEHLRRAARLKQPAS